MSNKVFFTSDTHFGHKLCAALRGFDSTVAHDATLVENWNKVVSKGDRVYHLGDFALGDSNNAYDILQQLNGQIFLVRGNHERVAETVHTEIAQYSDNPKGEKDFVWIRDTFMLKLHDKQNIFLSHYAHRVWNKSHHGAWHLYGHSHGSLQTDYDTLSFDVGVDCWNFAPISYDQVSHKMRKYHNFVPVDHHGKD